jgi:hypothetical protein
MRKPLPSLSTRTEAFTPRELPLTPTPEPVRRAPVLRHVDRAERIRDALRRWLEEEL